MKTSPTKTQSVSGELPTTGGMRPGPVGSLPPKPATPYFGALPVAIRIPVIQVDTDVEAAAIADGVLQDPSGPWVVAWYEGTSRLGVPGNVVLSGHLDYWGTGPAVFYQLGSLAPGDRIELTGATGQDFRYAVSWTKLFATATAPIGEIVGPTTDEVVTLITCGGTFDQARQEYEQRTVVRAARAG